VQKPTDFYKRHMTKQRCKIVHYPQNRDEFSWWARS